MAETYDINEISNNRSNTTDTNFLDADDELFSQLENEDEPKHIREARLNELVLKALEKQFVQKNKFEIYSELTEDEFLNVTTKTKKCIIHFYHPDFNRCNIINAHLQKIAPKFTDIRFAKINVDKAKFFVNKLKIQVLPAILCFVEGIVRDKIIGFEELGTSDNFPTEVLERRLRKKGILPKEDDESNSEDDERDRKNKFRQTNNNDSDSDN